MIVYRVTNKSNGKKYIGITRSTSAARWKQHCSSAKAGKTLIAKAIAKYGREAFVVEEIGSAKTWELLCAAEREAIAREGSLAPGGYNLTSGGVKGVAFHPEVHARSAKSRVGRKATLEHRAAISDALTGRRLSPEHARKMGLAHRGKVISEETRAKTSKTLRGRPHSPSHRANLAATLVERNRSLDQRQAVSAAKKGKPVSAAAKQRSGDGWRAWIAVPENRALVSARIAESNRRRACNK